jgi:hypothetical protein
VEDEKSIEFPSQTEVNGEELTPRQLVELVYKHYRDIQSIGQVMMQRCPEGAEQDMATSLMAAQQRFMEAIMWMEHSAGIIQHGKGSK